MASKPLILGEASNRPSGRPFAGRSGAFLAKLAGLTDAAELAERFDLRNLLDRWPGRSDSV